MTHDTPIFILTAELDEDSFRWLNGLRRQHFPVARNFLDAHLTLFHHLDADAVALIEETVSAARAGPMPLRFAGLRKLGRGVAVEIVAPHLVALRAQLARALAGRLTRQDSQGFRPHVTIQNKVDPKAVHALYDALMTDFAARSGDAHALQVWEYLGGPWRFVARLPLDGRDDGKSF